MTGGRGGFQITRKMIFCVVVFLLVGLVVLHNLIYPVLHGGDSGVDAGVLFLGAADAPGDDAHLGALAPGGTTEQGAAAVTLILMQTELALDGCHIHTASIKAPFHRLF